MSRRRQKRRIWRYEDGTVGRSRDLVAVEEPLEMQLQAGAERRTIAVTMRTPGNDYELTAGFLFAEGIITTRHDLVHMSFCVENETQQLYNLLSILLRRNSMPSMPQLERHFFTSSACGICGTTFIEDLEERNVAPVADGAQLSPQLLLSLPAQLRASQPVFEETGGLHAAALFDADGALLTVREDVGRHNALDKLVGWGLLNDKLPFENKIVMVSGRASYELLQKAIVAGVSTLCAVSAPSSLAVSLAQRFNVTLIGFLRDDRFNVYTNPQRLVTSPRP